jgi:hypothetical protein
MRSARRGWMPMPTSPTQRWLGQLHPENERHCPPTSSFRRRACGLPVRSSPPPPAMIRGRLDANSIRKCNVRAGTGVRKFRLPRRVPGLWHLASVDIGHDPPVSMSSGKTSTTGPGRSHSWRWQRPVAIFGKAHENAQRHRQLFLSR